MISKKKRPPFGQPLFSNSPAQRFIRRAKLLFLVLLTALVPVLAPALSSGPRSTGLFKPTPRAVHHAWGWIENTRLNSTPHPLEYLLYSGKLLGVYLGEMLLHSRVGSLGEHDEPEPDCFLGRTSSGQRVVQQELCAGLFYCVRRPARRKPM